LASIKPESRRRGADAAVPHFDDAEKRDWLRLIRSENIGPITFHQLIARYGTASDAIDAVPELRRRGGVSQPGRICGMRDAERELRTAERAGARIVALPEPDYPPLLRQIEAPPPILVMKGDAGIAARPAVAIVGSRSASAAGRQLAATLARDLGEEGVAVVSGLARGIDTAAHHAALATGTVAVVAGGIDIIYPPENAGLHGEIADHGLLISEAPLGYLPRGTDFPRRNRLISGISLGVVVVEAAERSGSLITARMALEQNREVFAIPGHPLDPRAIGTNALIKSGAMLVTGAADVLEALSPTDLVARSFREPDATVLSGTFPHPEPADELRPADRAAVIEALGIAPVSIDIVVRRTGLSPRQIAVALLELDIAGRLERHGQQGVSLRHGADIMI
jgi:DNA processing protein